MRYELYGVGRDFAFATEYKAYRSLKSALAAVDSINATTTPYFIVIELQRKSAVPIGVYAGKVNEGFASISHAPHVSTGHPPGKSQILSQDYLSTRFKSLEAGQ